MPVRMSQWETVRSRKREPKIPTDVTEKNLRMKRVKKRTPTSAKAHENYFSSSFLLLLKQMFSPSPQHVFAHSHFWYHRLPLVNRPGCGRRLVADLSLRSPRFIPRAVYVKLVMNKVALRRVFLRALLFCPVRVIPPTLYSNISFIDHRRHHINSAKGTVVKWNTSLSLPHRPYWPSRCQILSSYHCNITYPALHARLPFLSGRWGQCIPPKRGQLATGLQGYTCQKTILCSI